MRPETGERPDNHNVIPPASQPHEMTPMDMYKRLLAAESELLRAELSRLQKRAESVPIVTGEGSEQAAENALLRAEVVQQKSQIKQLKIENAGLQAAAAAASRRHFDSRARCEPGSVIVFPLLDGQPDVEVTVISRVNQSGHSVTFKASASFQDREELIALKCITTSPGQQSRVWREVNVWRSAVHPSLQRLLGVLRDDYENAGEHILASPWREDGNMLQYLRQFPEVSRLRLVNQVAEAVRHLHCTLKIVHGDIKCENVLISKRGNAILTDFGLSTFIRKEDQEATTSTDIRIMFTVDFCAPELFHDEVSDGIRKRSKTTQTDIYAFGMLVLQAFTLRRPWADVQSLFQLFISISQGALPQRPQPESDAARYGFTDKIWDMCLQCWNRSPQQRPSIADIVRDLHYPVAGFCCRSIVPYFPLETHWEVTFYAFLSWLSDNSSNLPVAAATEGYEFVMRLTTAVFTRSLYPPKPDLYAQMSYGRTSASKEYVGTVNGQGYSFVRVPSGSSATAHGENGYIEHLAFKNSECQMHSVCLRLDLYRTRACL